MLLKIVARDCNVLMKRQCNKKNLFLFMVICKNKTTIVNNESMSHASSLDNFSGILVEMEPILLMANKEREYDTD